jgi:hypothetical protein
MIDAASGPVAGSAMIAAAISSSLSPLLLSAWKLSRIN